MFFYFVRNSEYFLLSFALHVQMRLLFLQIPKFNYYPIYESYIITQMIPYFIFKQFFFCETPMEIEEYVDIDICIVIATKNKQAGELILRLSRSQSWETIFPTS